MYSENNLDNLEKDLKHKEIFTELFKWHTFQPRVCITCGQCVIFCDEGIAYIQLKIRKYSITHYNFTQLLHLPKSLPVSTFSPISILDTNIF